MWISIIIKIIVSIIIILIGHHLWNYLKDNYSVKKTKDLLGSQIQKYKTILEEVQKEQDIEQEKNKQQDQEKNKEQEKEQDYQDFTDIKKDLEMFLQELQ